jgi:hypothetical protein
MPWPGHEDTVKDEGPGEEPVPGAGEAQRGPHERPGADRRGHHRLLPARRRDQRALVAPSHEEPRVGDEPPDGLAALQRAAIVLGVDDPDARGHHHQVVEIGAASGYGSVVQDDTASTQHALEPVPDVLLAGGTAAPTFGGPLGAGDELDQRGEPAERCPPPRVVPGAAPFVLDPGRGAWLSAGVPGSAIGHASSVRSA